MLFVIIHPLNFVRVLMRVAAAGCMYARRRARLERRPCRRDCGEGVMVSAA